ncbi:MAG: hypothetical protein IKK94_08955, partial [Clostridia bacterium]|nr:hypothetical protein [Clostridia bacterium]
RLFTGDFVILDPEAAAAKRAARAESERLAAESRLLAEEARRNMALNFADEDEADDDDTVFEDDDILEVEDTDEE